MAKLNNPVRSLVAVGLASSAILLGAAAPAMAATTCSTDYVCMWEDNNYTGSKYVNKQVTSKIYDVGGEIGGWNGDNEISSVKNNTNFKICLYPNDTPTGYHIEIAPKTNVPNLAQSYGFDNDAESFRAYPTGDSCP